MNLARNDLALRSTQPLADVIARSVKDGEGWKYTSLAPLAAQKFAPAKPATLSSPRLPSVVADAAQRHQIVFANGAWRPELSQLGELEGLIEGDAGSGYRLRLAGQTCLVTAPVELVFLSDAPVEAATRLSIELGKSGRLTLIEHHAGHGAANVVETDISLGAQAKLVHGKIVAGDAAAHLARTRVRAEEGAYYDRFAFISGGALVRDEVDVSLGKSAQCALNGAMLLRGADHADTTTHIRHEAPFGTSREAYKIVATGKAKGVFQGRVTVEEGAQKTDAAQSCRALLLSDRAEIDAKPELRIYADDVKCSHGAAVGDLDAGALFYLRSRGIPQSAARALLIRGFVGETIDEIRMPELRDHVRARAEEWCDEQD